MINTLPQQPAEDVPHPPRRAQVACTEGPDACELLIAELEARRVRLQHLLHLVRLEAESDIARRVAIRPRARCNHARIKRTA